MKVTVSPSWVRWMVIAFSGLAAVIAFGTMMFILLGEELGNPVVFVAMLISLLLNGSICILAIQLEGPLRFLVCISGVLSIVSGVSRLLALLVAPAPISGAELLDPLLYLGTGVATFWVAMACITLESASDAS